MDTQNVIVFPKAKKDCPPQSLDEIHEVLQQNRENIVIDLAYNAMANMLQDFTASGLPVHRQECHKSIVFIMESVKCLLSTSMDIATDFNDMVEDSVQVPDDQMQEVINTFFQ